MTSPAPQKTRDFAERLLAYETAAAAPSPVHGGPLAFRVCEKLRRPLTTLAGSTGFQSLMFRALTLAKREAPSLRAVQIKSDGSLENCLLEPNSDDGGILLVAHLIGLLFTFIGETLTLRLIQDVWPDAFGNTLTAEGTEKHEPQG
jgi:hypothetical protein